MKPTSPQAWQRLGAQLHDAARAARHVADGQAAHTVPSHAQPARTLSGRRVRRVPARPRTRR